MSEKEPKATPDIPPEQEHQARYLLGPWGALLRGPGGDGATLSGPGVLPPTADFVGLEACRLGELRVPEGSGTGTG